MTAVPSGELKNLWLLQDKLRATIRQYKKLACSHLLMSLEDYGDWNSMLVGLSEKVDEAVAAYKSEDDRDKFLDACKEVKK